MNYNNFINYPYVKNLQELEQLLPEIDRRTIVTKRKTLMRCVVVNNAVEFKKFAEKNDITLITRPRLTLPKINCREYFLPGWGNFILNIGQGRKLMIGDIAAAENVQFNNFWKITQTINLSGDRIATPSNVRRYDIFIEDDATQDISLHFGFCNNIINDLPPNESILINCYAGRSRSAAICLSYLLLRYDVTFKKAYNYLQLCRPIIDINGGFKLQIKKYYQR